MLVKDLLRLYRDDAFVKVMADQIKHETEPTQLRGLVGSLDSVLATALYLNAPQTYLFVLNDKEEAAYFLNDLQNLLGENTAFLFPMSYKKPYQPEDIDNANVLMRAEVLSLLNNASVKAPLLVSYPDALGEKVVNKRSLLKNTFSIGIGDTLDLDFLSEFLADQGFERSDFVYEAGQYSVRGGIIDVFSYAHEMPFRMDLFGREVESIRTFNPETQLSVESVSRLNIVPDVQTKLVQETRDSFLSFLPNTTQIWIKDTELLLEVVEKYFEKTQEIFEQIVQRSGGVQVIQRPEERFETRRGFLSQLKTFKCVEFGRRFYFKNAQKIQYNCKPQPSFNKDFRRLSDNLRENQQFGYLNILSADSVKQLERLGNILEELDPYIKARHLNIALREGFVDEQAKIVCYTDHQVFDRFHRYRIREKYSKSKILTLKELKNLQPGDYVTHIDYGIGRFAGMDKIRVGESEQEAIRLIYRDDDLLYVSIHSLHKIAKYTGKEGTPPAVSKLGSQDWENRKARVKGKVKDIAKELISLYAKRKMAPGYAFSRDSYLQAELESSFLYEDTPDQAKATADVKVDMEKPHPMDRLVCGDVGFGKTEIAIRAAFKAVNDSKQVAVLVPTTVLAMQHFRTFRDRLEKMPCRVEYVNRFKSDKQIKETLKRVASGETDILIGTHRIVGKDIKFKNLGLLIIDEEQKFGVKTKDRLKEMRVNVDVLTLTATPIPRTLHFSLMGARDLSVIATPPPNRQPVTTEVHVYDELLIRDAVADELKRGGQVYFVHNRVSDLEGFANTIMKLVPDARVGVAHGQLDGEQLEKVMMHFVEGHYDVLVSTNIIESGLDIPNANTMLINNANHFGMSDLHQMRGRVGRSNRKAYCYLLTTKMASMTADARKRLQVLEEFSDLGDGFKVAMRDLDIRGAGNLLGGEQSGFINDLGYEIYHKILDEAVDELKETEFKELFAEELSLKGEHLRIDCQVETDLAVLIPETYISSITERLSLYTQLDDIKDEAALQAFQHQVRDRFGPIPPEFLDAIHIVRVRWKAAQLGFEKITLRNNNLRCYFVSGNNQAYFQSEKFGKILDYVKRAKGQATLKEVKGRPLLLFEHIGDISQLDQVFAQMLA
jgi:transcription-repair coupling factor (superfamily II helicase)